MTYKQIQASHEIRMWMGQVIIPAVTAGIILAANPTVRAYAKNKVENIKLKHKTKKSGK